MRATGESQFPGSPAQYSSHGEKKRAMTQATTVKAIAQMATKVIIRRSCVPDVRNDLRTSNSGCASQVRVTYTYKQMDTKMDDGTRLLSPQLIQFSRHPGTSIAKDQSSGEMMLNKVNSK
jgi:hypothetical protein